MTQHVCCGVVVSGQGTDERLRGLLDSIKDPNLQETNERKERVGGREEEEGRVVAF